ncbi:hypothetical protein [Streptomyces sp. NPDC102462]|uniref:hypothetical protein n=1 Tax=Streptomyces sp. NPDC102462 TaxID=3366178 RepID=UPI0037F30101
MNRMLKYLAGAAVTAAVAGMATVSHAAPAKAPHAAVTQTAAASAVQKTAPTPRIVASGERVTAVPGFQLWLTPEGKHWTTPSSPDPQFRSVVDGNIDRDTPGVTLQSELTDSRAYLSGLYYGGKGTASSVEIETEAGTVRGKLIELPGRPGWGVWYATAHIKPGSGSLHYVTQVTVRDTEGTVYAQLTTP